MKKISLTSSPSGHMTKVLNDLLGCGWRIGRVPGDAKIPRNGMRLHLQADGVEVKLRVFAFKVTTSGRNRPHERRVELTTTYYSGLSEMPGYRDVVLGIDTATKKYVGIDSKRLHIGGATHNASSFFDLAGLSCRTGALVINPRTAAADIFVDGTEHHAFFDRTRLAEYFFNADLIHSGSYAYGGAFSGKAMLRRAQLPAKVDSANAVGNTFLLTADSKVRARPSQIFIEAFESNDYSKVGRRKVTPADLKAIQAICEEVGALGEQVVLDHERRRLRKLGHVSAAEGVERISLRSVGEGYDIASFENDGQTKRYIEVKATIGDSWMVDISVGEWKAAKFYGSRYYIARVRKVRTVPEIRFVNDPLSLEKQGLIQRTPNGWRLDLTQSV